MSEAIAAIEAERSHHATRSERIAAIAGRDGGLGDDRAAEKEYEDGVVYGLDLALLILRGRRRPIEGSSDYIPEEDDRGE